ncbi:hypothetical protein HCN44_009685 [Aphidius gifuensis]|uniref:Uncharacterized protein n=1 Tax=Aphidius gifuensis TaxID=684658 RepID=A0A834Y7V8_APHGI|nr:hypothetical protein HCN44_009685 [Aphidius gifuensis]
MPNKNLKIAQEYESIMSLIKINNNIFVSSINECIKNIEASTNETVAREIIKAKICLKNETAKNNIITSTNLNKYDILNAKNFTSLYNAWNIILKSLETKQADIIKIIMSKAISSYNNVVNDMKINGKNYNCCLNTSINYIDKLKNKSLHAISGCFKNESLNFEKFYSSAILAKNITSFKNCLNNNDNIKTRLNCLDNHKPEKNIFTDIKNTIEKKTNNFEISINGCIEKTMKIHREFIIIGFMMFDKCIDNQKSDKCVELNINLTEKKIELENILDDESYMYNWEYYKSYVMIKFNN